LQRALRYLRLIGCVRSKKFAALNNGVRDDRAQVVVNSGAEKTAVTKGIFRRASLEILDNFGFRVRPGNIQRFAQPVAFRNTRKQIINGLGADGGEHVLPFGRTLGEIAH